ncbi:glutamate carboxypeptidase [Amphibacillus marinus]|uniref:Glutamate carboxypeptidase n=1 Tax=Amphibacillus marinus TaxID=872970 RepID=A0A1H8L333_9BACI|nr:M20/M25/M40 family metallo-hydrolase [Amphibacillus marinus]SEN99509.1 glutamate carboxypeptidase [Amphibacillus marinus]
MTKLAQAKAFLAAKQQEMIALWEDIIRIESPSQDIEAVNAVARYLTDYCNKVNLETKTYTFAHAGSSLIASTPASELPNIVLVAHMDTVQPVGSFGTDPVAYRDGFLHGPGAYDCKGGIVIALFVIQALASIGYDKRQLKLILSGDEEVAHQLSQGQGAEVFDLETAFTAAAFTCESARLSGDVITKRKGGAFYRFGIRGISAHAGNDPLGGASAIKEAAHKMIEIEKHTTPDGTTYNCGVIEGGTGTNVIPDACTFKVGVRFKTNADLEQAEQLLQAINDQAFVDKTVSTLTKEAAFLAMEETEKTPALFQLYHDARAELGYHQPKPLYVGGCSDSAYLTAKGIPTLCGVGVIGTDPHSQNERALVSSLQEQALTIVKTILAMPDDF